MLSRSRGRLVSRFLRRAVQTIRRAPQGDFAQGRQVFQGKEMAQSPLRLVAFIYLAGLQPGDQVGRLDVHQFHLLGGIKHAIRNPFAHRDMGDGGHQIVQGLQMLDIDGGVYVDSSPQQFFDVLVSLRVPAARRVAVRQFVHQKQLGFAFKGGVQIEFLQRDAFIDHFLTRELLQTVQQRQGVWAGMTLHVPDRHVDAVFACLMGGLQHGVCFAHAGGIAKKYFELSMAFLIVLLPYGMQYLLRVRPAFLHLRPSRKVSA